MSEETETVRVEIHDIAHGGDGVGRLPDGQVVFVPRTLPGEEVEIRVTESKPTFARGQIVEIHEVSGDRVESECPYFAECGGCQYWHLPYDREVDYKMEAAADTVERLSGCELEDPEFVDAPDYRDYRTRVRFHRRRVERDGERDWAIGFFAQESHDLVAVDDCPVTTERVNRARRQVEEGVTDAGDVELLVETADEDSAIITITPQANAPEEPPETLLAFAESLDEQDAIRGLRFVGEQRDWFAGDESVDGSQVLADSPIETIRVPAGLFRQANPAVNDQMVGAIREMIERAGSSRVLELFCGVGNLTFALRDRVDALLGVELDETAVEMAQTMAEFGGRDDIAFVEADLSEGLPDTDPVAAYPYDTVVLDPPRAGAPDVCADLGEADAETIVYVSCAPAALGRDLGTLTDGHWQIASCTMFDMFPRTSHVEVVTVLSRQ